MLLEIWYFAVFSGYSWSEHHLKCTSENNSVNKGSLISTNMRYRTYLIFYLQSGLHCHERLHELCVSKEKQGMVTTVNNSNIL